MKVYNLIIFAAAVAAATSSVSAEETVTLRRITGAELKYLYEFPTWRQTSSSGATDTGVAGDFVKCPGLSFVIVDKAMSIALPSTFVKDETRTSKVYGTLLFNNVENDVLSLSRSDYEDLRFVIKREDRIGSIVSSKAPTELPMSLMAIVDLSKNQSVFRDMKCSYTNNEKTSAQFDPIGDESTHPWISYETPDAGDFKIQMRIESKPFYIRYATNTADQYFRLYTTQDTYNLNIYQFENISVVAEPNDEGGVDVAISHVDDDPVMQNLEEGAIEMCVVMNDGEDVSVKDLMESETRYSLYDNGWKTSLRIEPVAVRAYGAAPTTAWMQPCYTLEYKGEKYSVPVGRITTVELNDDISTAIPEVGFTDAVEEPVIYYNLQGQRIASPRAGSVYLRVTPTSATKIRF